MSFEVVNFTENPTEINPNTHYDYAVNYQFAFKRNEIVLLGTNSDWKME